MLLALEIMTGADWTPDKIIPVKLKGWQQEGFVTSGSTNLGKSFHRPS